jgi:hypothetical protein
MFTVRPVRPVEVISIDAYVRGHRARKKSASQNIEYPCFAAAGIIMRFTSTSYVTLLIFGLWNP